ncbi:MAG: S8 family serine peptidase [Candidatus Kerfeldbacteria bacterium]|nr:S8 family serine peptidase [Candidatus Kerfeldbacteria bacterium]
MRRLSSFLTQIKHILIFRACLLLLVFLFLPATSYAKTEGSTLPATDITNTLVIEYRPSAFGVAALAAHNLALYRTIVQHADQITQLNGKTFITVTAENVDARAQLMKELQHTPGIANVQQDQLRHITVLPDDPNFSDQWHLQEAAAGGINAAEAWDTQTGSRNVVVAIIDTGVDTDHPDIADNLWVNDGEIPDNDIDDDGNGYVDDVNGYDFVDDNGNPSPSPDGRDNDGYAGADTGVTHGTHVAGIVAAVGDNGVGLSGVAWHASLMAVQVLDDEGAGTDSAIAAGIQYAVDNGANIVHMSLGGYGSTDVLEEGVNYAIDHGVAVIAAAGNDGVNINQNEFYPICYPQVIGVASTSEAGEASTFSNYGDACVDVAAPGEYIYSTFYSDDNGYGFDNLYGELSGTSMATPVVSGVATLLLSQDPTLSISELHDVITLTADDIDMGSAYGTGRVDAAAAVEGIALADNPDAPSNMKAYIDSKKKTAIKQNTRSSETTPYFTWSAVSDDDGIAGYYVYFGKDQHAKPVNKGTFQTGTTFSPEEISGDQVQYYLRVVAEDGVGNRSNSAAALTYIIDTSVAKPQQVTLQKTSNGVKVSWAKVRNEHVTQYRVLRTRVVKRDNDSHLSAVEPLRRIATVKQPKKAFIDKKVKPGARYLYQVQAVDDLDNTAVSKKKTIRFTPRERLVISSVYNDVPTVRVYNIKSNTYEKTFQPFAPGSMTRMETAVGDTDGDLHDEVMTAAGSGVPTVKIFEASGREVAHFNAYEKLFTGGVRVAVGDFDADGIDEIATVPGPGRPAEVRLFDADGKKQDSFFAFDRSLLTGAFITAVNWDGIGSDEIAVAQDAGGHGQVFIFSSTGKLLDRFTPYENNLGQDGIRLASVARSGSAQEDMVTTPVNGKVLVQRFRMNANGHARLVQPGFFGFVQTYTGGGTIAAGNISQIGSDRIVVGSNGDRQATIQVFNATGGILEKTLFPFGGFTGPITVASGWVY